jgi:hypothetical protein
MQVHATPAISIGIFYFFFARRLLFQALCVAGTLGDSLHLAPIHSTFC